MKLPDTQCCVAVGCGMLSAGICAVGNDPKTCNRPKCGRQPTADELELVELTK